MAIEAIKKYSKAASLFESLSMLTEGTEKEVVHFH